MRDYRKEYDKICPQEGDRAVGVRAADFSLFSGIWQLFSFSPVCAVNVGETADVDTDVRFLGESAPTGDRTGREFVWRAQSNLWDEKTYVLRVFPDHAEFSLRVCGRGAPERIGFFKGTAETFSQYYAAGYTVPQFQDVDHERAKQMAGTVGTLLPLRCAPPPFVFPYWNEYGDDWCGVGIAAPAGQNNYERLIHRPVRHRGFYLDLPLYGYTQIDGEWTSPVIWFGWGRDDMEIFHNYAEWTYTALGYGRHHGRENVPRWWKMPLFCGWGEQELLAAQRGTDSRAPSNQKDYTAMTDRLDRLGLPAGTVFIDDGWAVDNALHVNTQKWPDLRAFVDGQHAKGRRVVLWQHVWGADGWDPALLTRPATYKQTVDPTNPAFLSALRESIRRALSSDEGCYNCDGFKMDFLDNVPREESGNDAFDAHVYGLEMMRRLFEAYYRFAKEAKPDALINTSAVHPYFADVCDQIRLHDYWGSERCTVSMMKFRAALTRAVMPDVLIDTDHEHTENNQQAMFKDLYDSACGIPVLYHLSGYSDEELLEIKANWQAYVSLL